MTDIIYTVLRSALAFAILMTSVRLMGRKTIAEMTFFNFAVAITIGTLAGIIGMGSNATSLNAAVALLTITGLGILSAFISIKSLSFRKFINSEPVVLIENGKIIKDNMQKTRISINDLNALLRQKDTFNVADVEFAVLEIDGKLSVQPKSQKQPLTPSDLNIPTQYKGLTKELIIDGNIMDENLKDVGLDRNWLTGCLKEKGIESAEDVFFAALDSSGQLYVSKGLNDREKEGQHGIE